MVMGAVITKFIKTQAKTALTTEFSVNNRECDSFDTVLTQIKGEFDLLAKKEFKEITINVEHSKNTSGFLLSMRSSL